MSNQELNRELAIAANKLRGVIHNRSLAMVKDFGPTTTKGNHQITNTYKTLPVINVSPLGVGVDSSYSLQYTNFGGETRIGLYKVDAEGRPTLDAGFELTDMRDGTFMLINLKDFRANDGDATSEAYTLLSAYEARFRSMYSRKLVKRNTAQRNTRRIMVGTIGALSIVAVVAGLLEMRNDNATEQRTEAAKVFDQLHPDLTLPATVNEVMVGQELILGDDLLPIEQFNQFNQSPAITDDGPGEYPLMGGPRRLNLKDHIYSNGCTSFNIVALPDDAKVRFANTARPMFGGDITIALAKDALTLCYSGDTYLNPEETNRILLQVVTPTE